MANQQYENFLKAWHIQFPDSASPRLSCFVELDTASDFARSVTDTLTSAKHRLAHLEQAIEQEKFVITYLDKILVEINQQSGLNKDTAALMIPAQRPLRPRPRLEDDSPSKFTVKQPNPGKISKSVSLSIASARNVDANVHSRPESAIQQMSSLDEHRVNATFSHLLNTPTNTGTSRHLGGSHDDLAAVDATCGSTLRKTKSTDNSLHDANENDNPKDACRANTDDASITWSAHGSIIEEVEGLTGSRTHRSGSKLSTGSSSVSQSQDDIEEYLADEAAGCGDELVALDFDDVGGTLLLSRGNDGATATGLQEPPKTPTTPLNKDGVLDSPSHPSQPRMARVRRPTINERLSQAATAMLAAVAAKVQLEQQQVLAEDEADGIESLPTVDEDHTQQAGKVTGANESEVSVDYQKKKSGAAKTQAAPVTSVANDFERIQVLLNFLDDEAHYIDVLDVLNQYMKSMEASASTSARFMPLESVQAIFSRLRELNTLHKTFYDQLSDRLRRAQLSIPAGSQIQVADLFLPLISQLNVARDYANNYSRAVHTIKRYTVENAQFAELVRAVKLKSSKDAQTLESLLFRPVLRMNRHIDILRDLLAVTTPSHPDYPELVAMLKIAQQTITISIAPTLPTGSGTQPASSSTSIGHTIDSTSPGSLVRASLMVELVHDARKLRHVFLFSNLFVCAKLNQATDHFEIKWFLPIREITVYKVDDNLQEATRTKRRTEITAIKQRIATLRAELRREMQRLPPSNNESRKLSVKNTDSIEQVPASGSLKESSSMWSLSNLRSAASQQTSATKNVDRLRKKLAEQKAALVLASPSLLFELSRNSEKRYRFVMSSKFERDDWKAQIKELRKRLLPSQSAYAVDGHPRITVLEVKALIESCRLISPQVNELGKVLLASDADLLADDPQNEIEDAAPDSDSHAGASSLPSRVNAPISGELYVTIHSLECLSHRNSDLFVCIEVDSHGRFDLQARTRLMRNATDRIIFDQEFELVLEMSLSIRLLCYGRSQSLGEYLIAHADFSLLTERTFNKRLLTLLPASSDQKSVVIECSMRYVAPGQTIKRATESTDSASKNNLFGVPLEVVLKREGNNIPILVRACVDDIEKRGLSELGIYRIAGANSAVQELRKAFERDVTATSQSLSSRDVYVVADVLKLYLRELPEALFTDHLYQNLLDGYQLTDPVAKEKCMLGLLRSLPANNYATMMCLFDHLLCVADHVTTNCMTLQNLATVFGPNLLRPAFRNKLIQDRLDGGAGPQNQNSEISVSDLMRGFLMEVDVVLYYLELHKKLRGSQQTLPGEENRLLNASVIGGQSGADRTSFAQRSKIRIKSTSHETSEKIVCYPEKDVIDATVSSLRSSADPQPRSSSMGSNDPPVVITTPSPNFPKRNNRSITAQNDKSFESDVSSSATGLPSIISSEISNRSNPSSQAGSPSLAVKNRLAPVPPVSVPPRKPTFGRSARSDKLQQSGAD